MFNPLGALAAGAKGYLEQEPHTYEMMGLQALGKAFQLPQGPIDQQNTQGPLPPNPGQPSVPRSSTPDLAQGGAPQGAAPMGAPAQMPVQPAPALAGGEPPAGTPGASSGVAGGIAPQGPQAGDGMDLRSLMRRIQLANPGLPPQAMVAALTKALPMLNIQAKQQLLDIRRQMYGIQGVNRTRALDQREQFLNQRDQSLQRNQQRLGNPPPVAIKSLKEGHATTFSNGTKWTLENGKPKQIGEAEPSVAEPQPTD